MNKTLKMTFVLGLWLMGTALLTKPALAHDLWVLPQEDGYAVARGNLPGTLMDYDPSAVTSIRVLSPQGADLEIQRLDKPDRAFFKAPSPALVLVRCDWGHRVTTTRGKKLMSRADAEKQGFTVIKAFVSTQTSKTVFEDGEVLTRPQGLVFELVPETSPITLTPGQSFQVRALYGGLPLKEADITGCDSVKTRTDDQGLATITLSTAEWQVVSARHQVDRPDDVHIDYHQYMTFFIFKVKS